MGTVASRSRTSAENNNCEFGGLCDEISGKKKDKDPVLINSSVKEANIIEGIKKPDVKAASDASSQGLENESEIQKSQTQSHAGNQGLSDKSKPDPDDPLKSNGDLYPERGGGKYEPTWFQTAVLGEARRDIDKARCERTVLKVVDQNPLIKLMLSALKSSGCEFDLSRHVSCECCSKKVTGGYDMNLNQVVICQNVARSENQVIGALAHEMVHMFDFCRAKLDLKNIDHLACTEIRAANLMHCSFASAVIDGTASPFHIAEMHQNCVKQKALLSVLAVRDVTKEEAMEAVNRVFDKCYNDLEPVGRRLRRNSLDIQKAYRERYHYGYFD